MKQWVAYIVCRFLFNVWNYDRSWQLLRILRTFGVIPELLIELFAKLSPNYPVLIYKSEIIQATATLLRWCPELTFNYKSWLSASGIKCFTNWIKITAARYNDTLYALIVLKQLANTDHTNSS